MRGETSAGLGSPGASDVKRGIHGVYKEILKREGSEYFIMLLLLLHTAHRWFGGRGRSLCKRSHFIGQHSRGGGA
jgi:hypothetical protein